MRSLWNRIGQLVSGSRRGEERLPVAVGPMFADTDNLPIYRALLSGDADDVRGSLYRDGTATVSRSGSFDPAKAGTVGPEGDGTIPGVRDPGYFVVQRTFDPYQQEPAGYSHATLGGWTVTASIDCE